jgi:hypothetical protein
MAHPVNIYIIERHKGKHHTSNVGSKTALSHHTTLRSANWRARVLLHTILRDEDDNDLAQILA